MQKFKDIPLIEKLSIALVLVGIAAMFISPPNWAWRTTLILFFLIYPFHFLMVNILNKKSPLLVSAIPFFISLIATVVNQIPLNINTETSPVEMKALNSKLTLSDLFYKDDFKGLLRSHRNLTIANTVGDQRTVKAQVYLDFESQTKFLGFYIPNLSDTYEVCASLIKHYETAMNELVNPMLVEMKSPGSQPVNSSELNFSGRVFIYHEYPLLYEQQIQLRQLYKSHGLGVQFRGQDYLWNKKESVTEPGPSGKG